MVISMTTDGSLSNAILIQNGAARSGTAGRALCARFARAPSLQGESRPFGDDPFAQDIQHPSPGVLDPASHQVALC
jgi:hypothetical protein